MSESSASSNRQDDQSSSFKLWEQVRRLIEHEDNLTNQRLTWLFNSQALLFGAFALIFQALIKLDVAPQYSETSRFALLAISVIGAYVCLFLNSSIDAADKHAEALSKKWRESHKIDWNPHPPIKGTFTEFPYSLFHPKFLPYIFILGWVFLSCIILATWIHPVMIIGVLVSVVLIFGCIKIYKRLFKSKNRIETKDREEVRAAS